MDGETGQVDATAKPGKKKGLLVGLGMVIIALIIVVGFLMIKQPGNVSMAKSKTVIEVFYDLGEFTTNLSDGSELKYVRSKVTIELSNKGMETEVNDKEPVLRDCILNLLNNKTSADIMNRTKLKSEAITQLNQRLVTGRVTNIYFSDLIMQ